MKIENKTGMDRGEMGFNGESFFNISPLEASALFREMVGTVNTELIFESLGAYNLDDSTGTLNNLFTDPGKLSAIIDGSAIVAREAASDGDSIKAGELLSVMQLAGYAILAQEGDETAALEVGEVLEQFVYEVSRDIEAISKAPEFHQDSVKSRTEATVEHLATIVDDFTFSNQNMNAALVISESAAGRFDYDDYNNGNKTSVTDIKSSGSKISGSAELSPGAKLGKNVTVGSRSKIEECKIGDRVKIGANCIVVTGSILPTGVTIPDSSVVRLIADNEGGYVTAFRSRDDTSAKWIPLYDHSQITVAEQEQFTLAA